MPAETTTPNARTLSYKAVRDEVCDRHGLTSLDADAAKQLASFITSGYRQCLEAWNWAEAQIPVTVPVTDGLVTWTDLQGADHYRFFTADPLAESTRDTATPVQTLRPVSTGVYLNATGLTEVFALLTRRAPRFTSVDVIAATDYAFGDVRFDDESGHCYECIAEEGANSDDLADTAKWRPLTLLWLLSEPTMNLAEAALFSRSQERGQSSSLRNTATEQLDDLIRRQPQLC